MLQNDLILIVNLDMSKHAFFLHVDIAHCKKNQLLLAIWTTPQSKHALNMSFKLKMRDIHHLINEL